MQTDQTYALIEQEIQRYLIGNRTATTALLAWFLEAVWRLDPEEVSDAICDGGGDKGIDALYVDLLLKEIVVFQAKHRNTAGTTQGDKELKAFVGVATYFSDPGGIDSLLNSKPNPELRKLLLRHNVRSLLETGSFSVRLVVVTNAVLDRAGSDYITAHAEKTPILDAWDRKRLAGIAERTKSLVPLDEAVSLKASSGGIILETLGNGTKIAIALISGPNLVRLPGIDDFVDIFSQCQTWDWQNADQQESVRKTV